MTISDFILKHRNIIPEFYFEKEKFLKQEIPFEKPYHEVTYYKREIIPDNLVIREVYNRKDLHSIEFNEGEFFPLSSIGWQKEEIHVSFYEFEKDEKTFVPEILREYKRLIFDQNGESLYNKRNIYSSNNSTVPKEEITYAGLESEVLVERKIYLNQDRLFDHNDESTLVEHAHLFQQPKLLVHEFYTHGKIVREEIYEYAHGNWLKKSETKN